MTTLAARGSGTPATTGTTWASVTNAVDGAAGTNPATYATATNAVASAVQTIEITGYGFSTSIAATDTLNSVTVSLRHFENNTGRFASVTFQAFDGATAIGTATTCTLATAARNDVATPAVTLAQLRSSTFKIRVTITGAASTQSRVESIDYVDVTADYTIAPPAITQAAYRFYADGTETGSTAYTSTVTLADSYAETNLVGASVRRLGDTGAATIVGQSFVGNGAPLTRAGFMLRKIGAPVGNVTAVLYAHTGTYGSSGIATGAVLATSTTSKDSATLTTTHAWVDFDFDGAYTLVNGVPYVICATATGLGDFNNCVYIGQDNSSPTHGGNISTYTSPTWTVSDVQDLIFRVYTNNYIADTSTGDVNLQVRTRLQSTTAIAVPATDDWQLQYEKNASGTWTNVTAAVALADSYPSSQYEGGGGGGLSSIMTGAAQSFLGNGTNLVRVGFYLARNNNPDGTITAALYTHTGTFGTTGTPTGAALATTTTPVTAASLATSLTWVYFEFDRTFTLTNGTPYCIALTTTATVSGTSTVTVGGDNTSSTHPGNHSDQATTGGVWTARGTKDLMFEVYTGPATDPTTVLPYASANLTDGAATTNRLGAGSGSFVAGKVSETGLVSDLGWTANNYTEVLYSVTLKQADLAPTDTVRFRVLRNGATSGLTYTQVPTVTIGAGGPTDRTGTATGSVTLGGTAAGAKTVTATATGSLTLSGAAAGAPTTPGGEITGTATGTLTISGVAAGIPGVRGVAVGSLVLTGVAAGIPGVTATATGGVTLTGTAAGVPGVVATATGSLTLSGTASGVPGVRGVATGSLTLTGAATGQKTATATASGSLTVAGTAAGVKTIVATASSSLTLTGTATATKSVRGVATGQIVLGSSALGLVEGNAVGTATGQLTVIGLAVGRRGTTAVATGTFTITGLATGRRAVTATVTGTVTIVGTATGTVVGVAVSTVNLWNGTAFVDAAVRTWNGTAWVDATAVKVWNGSTFVDAI